MKAQIAVVVITVVIFLPTYFFTGSIQVVGEGTIVLSVITAFICDDLKKL